MTLRRCFLDGYIAVDHVELDIKEMLELGKRAANTHKTSSNVTEGQVTSTGRRSVYRRHNNRNPTRAASQLFITLLRLKAGLYKWALVSFLRASNHYPLSAESCK